jgi:hypothetical protein
MECQEGETEVRHTVPLHVLLVDPISNLVGPFTSLAL